MMNILKNTKTHRLTPDSILCRFCLASLIWIIIGGFSTSVWGNSKKNDDLESSRTWRGNHVSFTLSGDNGDNGTLQAVNVNANKEVTINWSVDPGCTIEVTDLKLGIGHNGWMVTNCSIYINNSYAGKFGTIINEVQTYSGYRLGDNQSFVFYVTRDINLYSVEIVYTIKPNKPAASSTTQTIKVTVDESNLTANPPQTVDFGIDDAFDEDSSIEFDVTPNSNHGHDKGRFYATAAGVYTVKARVNALTDCHEGTAWSDAVTVTVQRLAPTIALNDDEGEVDRTVLDKWKNYFDVSDLVDEESCHGGALSYSIVSDNSAYGNFEDADEDGVADDFYATVAGDYTIRITSAETTQYEEGYEDVTITVLPKAHPSYTMNNPSAATTLKVDGTIENAFTFKNVSGDANLAVNISSTLSRPGTAKGTDVISYDKATNTITALNAGTATLQFVQTATDDYYGASSTSYTFTVSKYPTTLEGTVAATMKVDETQTITFSATGTTATYPLEGDDNDFFYTIDPDFGDNDETTGCAEGHESDVIGYDPITRKITAYNAGSATVRIAQKETYKYKGDTLDLAITEVSKYTPTYTWNSIGAGYYYGAEIPNIFIGDEAGGVTITSSHEDVATVSNDGTYTLTISAKEDMTNTSTTITITQAENYKFNRRVTDDIEITPQVMPDGVPFVYTQDKFINTIITERSGTTNWDDSDDPSKEHLRLGDGKGSHYVIIHFEGTPDKLSFIFKANKNGGTNNLYIQESARNDFSESGEKIWSKTGGSAIPTSDYSSIQTVQLKPTTRYIKIFFSNTDNDRKARIKNLTITELQGYKYLKSGDKYLSRGRSWCTQAIMDQFGTPVRITRETSDNTNYTTKLMFVDSEQYLYESGDDIYTDNGWGGSNATIWTQTVDGEGKVTLRSATNTDKYITVTSGNLVLTTTPGDATKWELEDYTEHQALMDASVNSLAVTAATNTDLASEVSTLSDLSSAVETQYLDVTSVASNTTFTQQAKNLDRPEGGYSTIYTNTVNDLEPGLYRLSVQAFCHPASSFDNGWSNHTNGYESVLAYMFAGDDKCQIKSVYDEGKASSGSGTYAEHDGKYYPTDATAAEAVFDADADNYKNEMFVYVSGTSLTYGIHNASATGATWVAFKNYKLELVARDELTFRGSADNSWSTASNWGGRVPGEYDKVTIADSKNVEISGEETAYQLTIGSDATVTVKPTGGLTVGVGGIGGTGKDNITLEAGTAGATKGQTGYLRVSPDWDGTMPNATVELFSKAYADNEGKLATWQYVGSPLEDKIYGWDICTYGNQFIYGWSEKDGDWFDGFDEKLSPFNGYCLTQNVSPNGGLFTFTGKLVEPEEQTVNLGFAGDAESGNKGNNVVANSFTAPIDISKMNTTTDFVNATATIYMFNTGSPTDVANNPTFADKTYSTAGQYIEVTPGTAKVMYQNDDTYPVLIPAMQGFCVKATATGAKLKLNYRNVVWDADYNTHPNKPMRVAAQKTEEQEASEPNVTDFIKVTLADGEAADILYLLASESYDKSYENGYDAPKMMSDDPALPNIFAVEDDGQFAIDATSDIEGTFIGVRTGSASNYTIYFSHVNAETEWMLLDIQTNKTTRIANEASYSFSAAPNNLITNRFLIVEWDGNAGTATGTEETTIQNKIQKFIYNDQMYILNDGVLYDARGLRVR